jgi:transposase
MYPTDLTDSQWEVMKNLLPQRNGRKYSLRQILNAIFYITRTSVQWRLLPNDFPPYRIVFYYYRRWIANNLIKKINTALNKMVRRLMKKEETPSLCILDSQSVRNSERGVDEKGYDGNKRIQGRKRQILIDSLGLVWEARVHAANVHDSKGAVGLLAAIDTKKYARLRKILADKGYSGKLKKICEYKSIELEISPGVTGKTKDFTVIPQRWKVERTISWMQWDRRLSKDYEADTNSAEAFIFLFNIKRALRFL